MSSFRIDDDLGVNPELNQISSNLHGLGSSSTRVEIGGHDRTLASSEQRAESHGRKQEELISLPQHNLEVTKFTCTKSLEVTK
ncbi:hypothetical protein ZEAMMB73_Zm00001d046066 [Zea mays]|uniref:Uncharacterized protein n=1 Tax=Zea mays TaxID=4577 RepID=A0A1D6P0T3_MAIZE|nr:hypothetical protein ZEAMMB73_Zm00001d046066 [Zea mays]